MKKLMIISGYDYDDVVAGHIKIKQEWIMKQLVDKLSAEYTEEDNMNSTGMLCELIELKDCFSLISSKKFLADIYEMSFPTILDSNTSSRVAALTVLSKIIKLLPLNQKRNKRNKAAKKKEGFCFSLGTQDSDIGNEEDDEAPLVLILMQN